MACAREESSESSLEFDLCSDDCDDSDISFDDNGPSKVYEAAKSGDAALLNELLLDMDDSERAHTFETDTTSCCINGREDRLCKSTSKVQGRCRRTRTGAPIWA